MYLIDQFNNKIIKYACHLDLKKRIKNKTCITKTTTTATDMVEFFLFSSV
jgi:hypothetical protein